MEHPIIEQVETTDMSVRGGRPRNRASPGLHRNQDPSPTSISEEISAARTFGNRPRAQGPVHVVLPERGELPGDQMVALRGWYTSLQREFSNIIERCTNTEFLSDEWWELIDEAETCNNTAETILRFIRGA